MNQGNLFNLTEAEELRDQGIQRALDAGGEELKQLKWAIYRVACRQVYLTSDDVAEEYFRKVGQEPKRRASLMGAAFRVAAKKWIVEDTGRSAKSCRKAARGRKVTVWRSGICS